MGTNLQQLLPENIAQALCRTLIHSLWQGLIMAMLTGLVMLFTRKSSAAKRYRWLVGMLCIFTISFIFTLMAALNSTPRIDAATHNNGSGGPADLWELLNYNLLYIQKHAGVIVLIWLLVVCARSFKMLFGFYAVERLKRSKVSRISLEWEQKVNSLAQIMGIQRAIVLLESAIVKVPVAIGYLKPLILIPVGLVNALGQQEVEAILLHELAHIRRRDYLVNLLQSFAETIFFFNPAVLWLSSLIRTEREHCCDDMAVSHTKNKIRYISALVHFEEYSLSAPGYALALTGKNGGMLQRLERMAANRNRSLNKLELAGLALLLLLSTLFIAAGPGPALISTANKTARAPMSPELRKYLHDRELAARKRFLEQKEAAGTATKSEAVELLRYVQNKEPAATIQTEAVPISPELRKYIHDREVAVATHQPGAVPLTPEFKKYILDREVAIAKRLKAEKAAGQRTRLKDSIP
jgi:bla regulator protein BlaR1